ncbi:MAG TPA: methyltransferase domain-containing protein [Gaiellaceae bacterium]
MTNRQRIIRLVTNVVVHVPPAWRLLRRYVARDFDGIAPTWESRVSHEGLRALLDALDALPAAPARVLDVGTGTGRAARALSERWPDAEIVGVDLAPRMIEEARKLGGRVHYDVADSEELPYDDGAFDLVTLNNMIPFFDELARVTAPGGHVAIAYSMGDQTPIYVPSSRLRAELGRRGFETREIGMAVLGRKA